MRTRILKSILIALIILVATPILPQSEMTTADFTFSNLYFVDNFTYLHVRGEVKNDSQKVYGNAYFSLKLYDEKNELIGVILIFVNNIGKGQRKPFESTTDHVDLKLIKKYKIVYDSAE